MVDREKPTVKVWWKKEEKYINRVSEHGAARPHTPQALSLVVMEKKKEYHCTVKAIRAKTAAVVKIGSNRGFFFFFRRVNGEFPALIAHRGKICAEKISRAIIFFFWSLEF